MSLKIILVSDFGIHHTPGGAQRSNQLIIDEGIRRGHHIEVYHYDSDFSKLHSNADIVISSNLDVISKKYPFILNYFAIADKHIRLEHDFCRYINDSARRYLYTSCDKTFFLTQYHYSKFKEYYGDYFVNVHIVPDPINKEVFYNKKLDRSDTILYVGYTHYLKGTDNFIEYAKINPDKQFIAASWGEEKYIQTMREMKNIQVKQFPFDAMPDVYNSYKEMYYDPVFDEPFCRAVGEALMCGVSIIGDSNKIGSLHMYNEDPLKFADKCHNAASDFWSIIEND